MATVSLAHANRSLFQHPSWERISWVPSVNRSLVRGLGRLVQQSAGLAMLLFGCAMLFTLWLIPVGLPLALLGLAMISPETMNDERGMMNQSQRSLDS